MQLFQFRYMRENRARQLTLAVENQIEAVLLFRDIAECWKLKDWNVHPIEYNMKQPRASKRSEQHQQDIIEQVPQDYV